MKYISKEQVEEKLEMKICIELMRELFKEGFDNIVRQAIVMEPGKIFGLMPGYLPYKNVVGAKLISVFHNNYQKGLPSHQGIVALFSSEDGSVKGICDGNTITGIRTGAMSALATDYLANKDATVLALIGAGVQARSHLDAITKVRDIKEVRISALTDDEVNRFIESVKNQYPGITFKGCTSVKECCDQADIICTLTPSHTPILLKEYVKVGAHINAVGACASKDRELDSMLVKDAYFICDSKDSCMKEAGDFLFPLQEGLIDESHLKGTLHEIINSKIEGRTSSKQITCFEALGLAVEDIACAYYLLD